MSVRVPAAEREAAIALLLDLAPAGFEEVDAGAHLELAVFTDEAGAARLRARLRSCLGDIRVEPVAPGWEDAWRGFHRPAVAGGLWIGPPWEAPPKSLPAVVIEPGRAFGTGAHPTTRLCVELLAGCEPGSLLDVGCGSGVLAIAAARLGFGPVAAVDSDAVAVETTRENARRNGVELDARVCDALHEPLPTADVAVANVLLAPVEAILARLDARVAVTSGYLEGEVPGHDGWVRRATVTVDGWAADRFERA